MLYQKNLVSARTLTSSGYDGSSLDTITTGNLNPTTNVPNANLWRPDALRRRHAASDKMWLVAPAAEETADRGGKQRTTTLQGSGQRHAAGRADLAAAEQPVHAPVRVGRGRRWGHEQRLKAYIVNYADDFVIWCRGSAEQALAAMRIMISKLKLTVNEATTHVCRVPPQEKFDFPGYTFGRCYFPTTGRAFIGTEPSKKRVARVCAESGELTGHNKTRQHAGLVVARLNRVLNEWADYFWLGPTSRAYRAGGSNTPAVGCVGGWPVQDAGRDANSVHLPLPASEAGDGKPRHAQDQVPVG